MIVNSKLIAVVLTVIALSGCARSRETAAPVSAPASVSQAPDLAPVVPAPARTQAKKPAVDKKVPVVIDLGNTEEISQLNPFKKLLGKPAADGDYEKLRIEYLLERLTRTSYNFVRNGEMHNGKKAALHMRYKWTKFRSEVNTAEDFVTKIASGSRISNEPYHVKANNRYYRAEDVLLFELGLLDRTLREQEGKAVTE